MPRLTSSSNSNAHLVLELPWFQNDENTTLYNSAPSAFQNQVVVDTDINSSSCEENGSFSFPSTHLHSHLECERKIANKNFDELNEATIKVNTDENSVLNHDNCQDFGSSNDSPDELQMLLIQKECEIVCLRSELEIYKEHNNKKDAMGCLPSEPFPEKEYHLNETNPTENEDDTILRKLVEKIKYLTNKNLVCSNSELKCKEVQKDYWNTISSVENPGAILVNVEHSKRCTKYENTLHTGAIDVAQIIMVLRDPFKTVKTILSERENMELERQKTIIHKKELCIQQERLALEEFRRKLDYEKQALERNRIKIEKELRKLLDDDEQDRDHEENEREKLIQNKIDNLNFNEKGVIDVKDLLNASSNPLPKKDKENKTTIKKVTTKERENKEECERLYGQMINKNSEVFSPKALEEEDDETTEMTEAETEEIVNDCENKLNQLHNFMAAWKMDVLKQACETKVMKNECLNSNKTLGDCLSISDAYQMAIKALNKEWKEIKEADKIIKKQKRALITQESELEARIIALKEKERIVNEDKIEVEKKKMILSERWERLTLDADQCKKNKLLLEREGQILEESRNIVEKEIMELKKMKGQYEEEKQIAEEIRNQVDENRTQAMLEQQKCLEDKWELLNNEKEKLAELWRRYDKQLVVLEFDKSSVIREREDIQVNMRYLEEEKLALEKDKTNLEESRVLLEEEWKKFKSKRFEIDRESANVEEKRKALSEEWEKLNNERLGLNEMKESLLRKENEVSVKEEHLEEKMREILKENEKLRWLQKEAGEEQKKLEKEKRECSETKEEYKRAKLALNKKLKLKKTENTEKINKKVLKLAEKVSIMEEEAASYKKMQIAMKKNNLGQHFLKNGNRHVELGTNQKCYCSEYVQQRILNLLDTVNSMEKDARKIRIKINEKVRLCKKMRLMRKRMKFMNNQTCALQEKLRKTNAEYKNELLLTPRLKDTNDYSFMTRLEEDYTMDSIPQKRTLVMDKAKQLVEDWKNKYIFQGNKNSPKLSKDVPTIENRNYGQNHEIINIDDWEACIPHKINVNGIAPESIKYFEETIPILKEKTYWSDDTLNLQIQSRYRGHANTTIQNRDRLTINYSRQKTEGGLQIHSPFNLSWREKPLAPISNRIGKERSAWDIAFFAVMLVGCGAPFLLPFTLLQFSSSVQNFYRYIPLDINGIIN